MDKSLDEFNVLLAIPCFNCERQIKRVLSACAELDSRVSEIWVVDNRSSDDTLRHAKAAMSNIPILKVFQNSENINLGGTHKTVFQQAQRRGFTHVVIFHGDDQASTEDIPGLLNSSLEHGGVSVLGSRFMKGSQLKGYDWKRRLGNRVLNSLFSLVSRRSLKDLGSGINLYRLSDLDPETYLRFGNTLTFNYEQILDFVRRDVNFKFVPISWKEEDQVSNAKNLKIFFAALRILFRWVTRQTTAESTSPRTQLSWDEVL